MEILEKIFMILLLIFSLMGLILEGSSLFEIVTVGLLFLIFMELDNKRNTK